MVGSSTSVVQAANEYFDALVKSRFIEMFGDESFESKQLFDLFKTSSGGTPLKSKKQYYDGGTIPWLTSGEVDRLHINSARSKITQIAIKETSAKIPPIGSVLVSMYGSVGYAGILEFEAAINQAICAIHPNPDFSPEWLCYYVRSKKEELTNQAVGAALNNISQDKIRKLMVPCPPIELQNEFTKFVRQVDKSKLLFQQVVSKYDELVKSRFIEMFGILKDNPNMWPIESFNEFAEIDTKMIKDYDKYADYPHIGVDSIQSQTGELIGFRTVKEDAVVSGKYLFGPQHIIYSKIRPNLNKVALPDFEGLCSADAYPILPKSNCNRVYLAYVLRSEYYLSYILKLSGRSNIPKVNKVQIQGFKMPLPPIELQNQFADFVRQVDKSKSEILEGIKRLKTNRITEQ